MTNLAKIAENLVDFATIEQDETEGLSFQDRVRSLQSKLESLKVVDKNKNLVNFILWPEQKKLYELIMEKIWAYEPIRFIIPKARQLGFSTFVQGFEYQVANTWPNIDVYFLAESKDKVADIFARTRRFWMETPDHARRSLTSLEPTKLRLEFAPPWYSKIACSTSRYKSVGRGMTPTWCHFSEFAFWEGKPDEVLLGIINGFPKKNENPFNGCFIESTANGPNQFKQIIDVADETGWTVHFESWLKHHSYRLHVVPGQIIANSKHTKDSPEVVKYVQEVEDLTGIRIDDEQIKWMLYILEEKCRNRWELFNQEYPATLQHAFQSTGKSWFNQRQLARHRKIIERTKPLFHGKLVIDATHIDVIKYTLVEEVDSFLTIWEYPVEGATYVMSLDPGTGIGADWSVGYIMRLPDEKDLNPNKKLKIVAEIRENDRSPEDTTMHLWALGHMYGYPLWLIERTGIGRSPCAIVAGQRLRDYPAFKKYPNLYTEIKYDREIVEDTDKVGYNFGSNKHKDLSKFRNLVDGDGLEFYSTHLLREMEGFVYELSKKPGHGDWAQKNPDPVTRMLNHDDCVISAALAFVAANADFERRFLSTAESCDR